MHASKGKNPTVTQPRPARARDQARAHRRGRHRRLGRHYGERNSKPTQQDSTAGEAAYIV